MSDLVGNPEDRFSRVAAQILLEYVYEVLYIIDSIILILFKAITYYLYI